MDSVSRIVEIDPVLDERWDQFVAGQPRATVHHLGAWARILASCYGYRPRYIALESSDKLVGVLPLVSSGPRLSGSRLSSLPTAKAAGPLADSLDHERALLAAALEIKRSEGLSSMKISSQSPGLADGPMQVELVSFTQVLQLDRPQDEMLAAYKGASANLFRSIRKAQKSGLVVEETGSDRDLREWYRLYLLTIRRHRALPRRLRQLKEAREKLGPYWRLVTVKKDGAVVAGGVFHDIAGTMELVYSASDPDNLSLRPNHALYWHVITDSLDRGRAALDFGTSNHESLERFKEQWGATRHDLFYYGDAGPGDGTSSAAPPASTDTRASKKNEIAARVKGIAVGVLAASPLSVNRALGAVAYRIV